MLRLLTLATLAIAHPATAQDAAWPPQLVSIIDEARTYCDGEFSAAPETVVQRDLNGDGTPDWILDSAGFRCSTAATLYCGTSGCGVDTLIDGTLASLMLHSWDTVAEDGTTYLTAPNDAGETVRFLWVDDAWVLQ
jgi:hypothetical protein